jgi:predicted RNA-binding Zn-ribbon protein involved in translation (DUF1610 family)
LSEIEDIRKNISKKLSEIKVPGGKGTFDVSEVLNEVEQAVFRSEMYQMESYLKANLCPNCKVHLEKVKIGIFSHIFKCPKCGFTLAGK